MPATVNKGKCPHSHLCPLIALCPVEAISQKSIMDWPEIDEAKCIECGVCADNCPMKAVEMK